VQEYSDPEANEQSALEFKLLRLLRNEYCSSGKGETEVPCAEMRFHAEKQLPEFKGQLGFIL
jgi:hypothetical protein